MDIELPKTPYNGEIFKSHPNLTYYYRWNGFAWETINYSSSENNSSIDFSLKNIFNETPDGIINSINREFKLNYLPELNTECVYLNGMLQKKGENYDYIILDKSIYFNLAPLDGSIIICSYLTKYYITIKNESPSGFFDGSNKEFSLKSFPVENTERIYLNGILQKKGSIYDYIILDNKIIFNDPPLENSIISCFYESIIY